MIRCLHLSGVADDSNVALSSGIVVGANKENEQD